jgi:hypothetical protein
MSDGGRSHRRTGFWSKIPDPSRKMREFFDNFPDLSGSPVLKNVAASEACIPDAVSRTIGKTLRSHQECGPGKRDTAPPDTRVMPSITKSRAT